MRHVPTVFALSLIVAFSARADGRDGPAPGGKIVPALGASVTYVFHAKNGDYWFGSNDRGVYRYDGKTLVNFTTKDGLVADSIRGIQADGAGNLYFTTYKGISRFDGRVFTTLAVSDSPPTDWKKNPGDLWFVGPPDAGVVYRYDGKVLHRLKFPATKLGDDHFKNMPRDKFPNAVYSPYDVYCILKDSKGDVWFGTTCVGVGRYDGKSFAWLTDKFLTEAPVRCILEDRNGDFRFTYSGHGSLDGPKPVADFGKAHGKAKGSIVEGMSAVEDADGRLWTAAFRAGAFRHDGKTKTHFPITDGKTAVEVFAVYKDNRGIIWLGTHNGGAYRFDGKAFVKFRP